MGALQDHLDPNDTRPGAWRISLGLVTLCLIISSALFLYGASVAAKMPHGGGGPAGLPAPAPAAAPRGAGGDADAARDGETDRSPLLAEYGEEDEARV